MKEGATVITPNNRLSNQLIDSFSKHLKGHVHVKPRCFPYQAYLRYLFKKACHVYTDTAHPLLLTASQQHYLWQQTLATDTLCNEGLLSQVQNAWTRCQQWEIDSHHPAFTQTPQTQQFQQWQQQMEQRLKKIGAMTDDQLAHYLLNYPKLLRSNHIVWACFDDYTPVQQRLQKAIHEEAAEQYTYDLAPRQTPTYHYSAKDTEDEYLQVIQWLLSKQAAGETEIAVVVPDLQTQSHRLQRLFQRYISPTQFNISLGQPLANYPIIAHALHWLSLDNLNITQHQARLLLHSPYLAGSRTECILRTEAMENQNLLKEPMLSLSYMKQTLQNSAPKLLELLHLLPAYPTEASPHEWVSEFKMRLVSLGFPGEYSLHSEAYQCVQRFIGLFDELLQLSVIEPNMSKSGALKALHDLAQSTIFQPKTTTTPIQILGLLEASGCSFESIWVCGLTDQCLPQRTNLSAFIPIELQRELLMPHALPSRELQFAEQTLQRLQHGSHECVFSHPELTGDSPNLPSPLITEHPLFIPTPTSPTHKKSLLVERQEAYALPLTSTEPVSGGTTLLANQALCPFRAFATHRLRASPAPAPSEGPDASERGQIIHRIMELLWRDLNSQQKLLALTRDELNQCVKDVILRALTPLINEKRGSFSQLIQDVEISRLERLVHASLDWEKERPPFTIEAIEQAFTLSLAGIDFSVRVDRLDKIMGSDKKWIIDYKSTLPINKPWNEDRPEAPQLLLYALLDDDINTLLFIQLKSGRLTCAGLSEEETPVQGIGTLKKEETWALRREQWQNQLRELAEEFSNGHCPPQPFRKSTCQRCDFPHLCRIEQ